MSKPYYRSFAAGEIAEELYGRVDLAKRQTGLGLSKNFWVLPHGPAQNCPGFKYVLDVKDSTNKVRLVGFAFSDTQTMVLEFGAGWIRFHTAGGTVLEPTTAITGITQANPGVVTDVAHGYANGQTVQLAAIGGMTQLNGRFVKVAGVAANTFQLQDLNGVNINTTGYGAYTAGGTAARVYEIVSPYAAADLFDEFVVADHPTGHGTTRRRGQGSFGKEPFGGGCAKQGFDALAQRRVATAGFREKGEPLFHLQLQHGVENRLGRLPIC